MAFDLASAQPVTSGFDLASATPVHSAPKEGDPVSADDKVPEGFYSVTGDDGKKTLRHESGFSDVVRALSDLPGVGMAERIGQGATRLAGKVASGLAGLVGGADTVEKARKTVNDATELPESHDPLVSATEALSHVAGEVAKPADRFVGNLPAGPRTAIEATEEAIPDIATVLGAPGGTTALRGAGESLAGVGDSVKSALTSLVEKDPQAAVAALRNPAAEGALAAEAPPNIARSPAEVAKEAGYTGLKTKSDLTAPGNQAITDALIAKDAGIVPGQRPSVAALENAAAVGPGRVYRATEEALPHRLTQDEQLRADLGDLPKQVSQLPRSPDVDALQETMLNQPEFTRDELFANIREARERAKAHWKSDDPDKGALGDAYKSLADAYEDFAGRQPGVDLPAWQAARVQMAKNYQARAALQGPQGSEHFNAQAYARVADKNPHLLTGDAAIVGHVARGLPTSAPAGLADILPEAAGVGAGGVAAEALGHALGVPGGGTLGAIAGHYAAAPFIRSRLQSLLQRGAPDLAAGTGSNPALSYFFDQSRMPTGWNRTPVEPQIAGLLPSPDMINAGGGATTANTLRDLGLTPDVQAAAAAHPAAARLSALREQLASAPERPAEPVDFQPTPKWGDFSIAPEPLRATAPEGIPFENVLEQGGTQRKPIGAPATSKQPGRIAKSPAQPNVRTPPGAPTVAAGPPPGPSPAQVAFRNELAADRLRKVAGDLRLEGPGGATGDPIERARAALDRQQRGYAEGGSVEEAPKSPAQEAFARNSAYAMPAPASGYLTQLSPEDEQKFQQWVQANKVPFDPSPTADYDMRGFWQGLQSGDLHATSGTNPNDHQLHFSDWWKTPYHQSFSAESQWATSKAPHWNDKDQLVLSDGTVVFDERATKPTQEKARGGLMRRIRALSNRRAYA